MYYIIFRFRGGTKCKMVAFVTKLTAAPFGLARAGLERLTPNDGINIVGTYLGRYIFHNHGSPFDILG